MPERRGPDGRPVHLPTQPPETASSEERANNPQRPVGSRGKGGGLRRWPQDEAPTSPSDQRGRAVRRRDGADEQAGPGGEEPTGPPAEDRSGSRDRHAHPSRDGEAPTVRGPRRHSSSLGDQPPPSPSEVPADLPTGWLVVVDGPGKGTTLALGYGHNTIGRGAGMHVQLNFGDEAISREHTAIRYSDRNNTFHIFPGQNNVYLAGNEEVLTPTPLPPGSLIGLGETTLRFMPFCDDTFRWD